MTLGKDTSWRFFLCFPLFPGVHQEVREQHPWKLLRRINLFLTLPLGKKTMSRASPGDETPHHLHIKNPDVGGTRGFWVGGGTELLLGPLAGSLPAAAKGGVSGLWLYMDIHGSPA